MNAISDELKLALKGDGKRTFSWRAMDALLKAAGADDHDEKFVFAVGRNTVALYEGGAVTGMFDTVYMHWFGNCPVREYAYGANREDCMNVAVFNHAVIPVPVTLWKGAPHVGFHDGGGVDGGKDWDDIYLEFQLFCRSFCGFLQLPSVETFHRRMWECCGRVASEIDMQTNVKRTEALIIGSCASR